MMFTRKAQPDDMETVWRCTYDVYREQGYCDHDESGLLVHYPHLDGIDETTVYVVEDDGEIVGTNSLTLDGQAGLHVDADFPVETGVIRKWCRHMDWKLGASWRIVTRPDYHRSIAAVSALFQETIRGILEHKLDVVLFAFNPKHARAYQRLLGLTVLANGWCDTVSAPSVLMGGQTAMCEPKWRRFLG